MSLEIRNGSTESDATGLNFDATELTLSLPGASRAMVATSDGGAKSGMKRGFSETGDLINLGERSKKDCRRSDEVKLPATTAQVVGWPPVRDFRKNAMKMSCKYVKVAVDGAPYLRKVDLETYKSYQQLLSALEEMFSCFIICNYLNEKKIVDHANGVERVPTYEDKDGDWMLVGDVPWNMFVDSCKRLRLMKSLEAIGLAPRTPPRCSSTTT